MGLMMLRHTKLASRMAIILSFLITTFLVNVPFIQSIGASPPHAAAILNPASGSGSTRVTATGGSDYPWDAGAQIVVKWDTPDGPMLAQATVGSAGSFTVAFSIPANAAAGNHDVVFDEFKCSQPCSFYTRDTETFVITSGGMTPPTSQVTNSSNASSGCQINCIFFPTTSVVPPTGGSTGTYSSASSNVQVDARQGGQSTGISVSRGMGVTLAVTGGTWTHWRGTVPYNAGQGNTGYICANLEASNLCVEPMPTAPTGALIAKVGYSSFAVGNGTSGILRESGTLFLRINDGDDGLYDNDGILTVQVSVSSPTAAAPAPASPSSSHRYVVFVLGINSEANGANNAYFEDDMGDIKKALRNVGYDGSHFVYFSYGAAADKQGGGFYCGGWGPDACSPSHDLVGLNIPAVYPKDDTHLFIEDQADALDWLLGQILKVDQDPSVQIDIVTHSLGGIVSSWWATTHNRTTATGSHVHSITLIESPIGGIYAATALLNNVSSPIVDWLRIFGFGEKVLTELQVPAPGVDTTGSLVPLLANAANTGYRIVSIESDRDYLVSGRSLPTNDGDVVIGVGTQFWPQRSTFSRYSEDDLGGTIPSAPVALKDFQSPLSDNHGAPLHAQRTSDLVVQTVSG